jgi:hypothetical protein
MSEGKVLDLEVRTYDINTVICDVYGKEMKNSEGTPLLLGEVLVGALSFIPDGEKVKPTVKMRRYQLAQKLIAHEADGENMYIAAKIFSLVQRQRLTDLVEQAFISPVYCAVAEILGQVTNDEEDEI